MSKENIVYWAPAFNDTHVDWNMLYSNPTSLYDYLRPNLDSTTNKQNNFFYCPAFKDFTKNTFVLENPIETHFVYRDDKTILAKSKNYISTDIIHSPSLTNNLVVTYGLQWVFFSEQDIDISVTSPYFTPSNYSKYAALIPGKYKINNWFRTVNIELNLWENNKELHVLKDEPIAYVNFHTNNNDPVILKRFDMTPKLHTYTASCGRANSWESWIPLVDRYKRFKQSRTNELVLKEIKNNLISNV
jgi:hypothetical protein